MFYKLFNKTRSIQPSACSLKGSVERWTDQCYQCSKLSFWICFCFPQSNNQTLNCFPSSLFSAFASSVQPNNRTSAHFLWFLAPSAQPFCNGTQRLICTLQGSCSLTRRLEGRVTDNMYFVVSCLRCEKTLCGRWYVRVTWNRGAKLGAGEILGHQT